MRSTIIILTIVTSIVLFSGCAKETVDGKNALVDLIVEPAGSNCPNGGFNIVSGTDADGNNILDPNEIESSEYVCNGEDGNNGSNALIDMIPEPPGDNCTEGGVMILTGLDSNNNGMLDESEVQKTEYLCNIDEAYNNHDKLLRIPIARHGIPAFSTEWVVSWEPTFSILDFHKDDYVGVDSIVFVPSLSTGDSNNKAIVELYNKTDDEPIENSHIESNSTGYNYHYSKDIYDDLPSKRIELGIRIKSETDGVAVATGLVSYLFIYKH